MIEVDDVNTIIHSVCDSLTVVITIDLLLSEGDGSLFVDETVW